MIDTIDESKLAGMFGVSSRTVRALVDRDLVVKLSPGCYDLKESVRRYCAHLRETAAGRSGAGADGVKDLSTERAILTKQQRLSQVMKNAQLKGELVPLQAVTRSVEGAFGRVRGKLLGMPAKMAGLVIGESSVAVVKDRLATEIHEVLAELADFEIVGSEPDDDVADTGEAGEGGDELAPSVSASAEVDGERVGGRKPPAQRRGQRRAGAVAD